MTLPRFDIINGNIFLKPDGMCVHSALVDELEMKLAHAVDLLNVWRDAFGAECYNDALTAHDLETEKFLQASTSNKSILGIKLDIPMPEGAAIWRHK
jgi:hypothetical protein